MLDVVRALALRIASGSAAAAEEIQATYRRWFVTERGRGTTAIVCGPDGTRAVTGAAYFAANAYAGIARCDQEQLSRTKDGRTAAMYSPASCE